jgi:hypothetical protein
MAPMSMSKSVDLKSKGQEFITQFDLTHYLHDFGFLRVPGSTKYFYHPDIDWEREFYVKTGTRGKFLYPSAGNCPGDKHNWTILDLMVFKMSGSFPINRSDSDRYTFRELINETNYYLNGSYLFDNLPKLGFRKTTGNFTGAAPAVASEIKPLTPIIYRPTSELPEYLAFRGITEATYNSPAFAGRCSTFIPQQEIDERLTGFRIDHCKYPPIVFPYFDKSGNIAVKEYKGFWRDDAFAALQREDPTEKRTFQRYLKGYPKINSVWMSNVPANPTHIYAFEAVIDAYSFYQLHENKEGFEHLRDRSILIATGGQLLPGQIDLFQDLVDKHKIKYFQFCNDTDKIGRLYDLQLFSAIGDSGLPTFRVHGVNKVEGFTIEPIRCSPSQNDFLINELKRLNPIGELKIYDSSNSGRGVRLLFNEHNYKLASRTLAALRPNNSIKFKQFHPDPTNKEYKDWNDLLRGVKGHSYFDDRIPLADYMERFPKRPIRSDVVSFSHIRLTENLDKQSGTYFSIFSAEKDNYLGTLHLNPVKLELFIKRAHTNTSEMKLTNGEDQDIQRLVDFYQQDFKIAPDKFTVQILSDLRLDGNRIMKGDGMFATEQGHLQDGRVVVTSMDLPDQAYDSLEVLQELHKLGIPYHPNLFQLKGFKLILSDLSDKQREIPLFRLGADLSLHPYEGLNDQLKPLAEKLENCVRLVIPQREYTNPVVEVPVNLNKDRVMYGNREIGTLDMDARVFTVYPEFSNLSLPKSFYQQVNRIYDVGFNRFRSERDVTRRLRVEVPSNDLYFDDKKKGRLNENGILFLRQTDLSFGLGEALHRIGFPDQQIKIVDSDNKIHPYRHLAQPELPKGPAHITIKEDKAYMGDTHIGFFRPENGALELLPHAPADPFVEAARERLESRHRFTPAGFPVAEHPSVTIATRQDVDNGYDHIYQRTIPLREHDTEATLTDVIKEHLKSRRQAVKVDKDKQSIFDKVVVIGVEGLPRFLEGLPATEALGTYHSIYDHAVLRREMVVSEQEQEQGHPEAPAQSAVPVTNVVVEPGAEALPATAQDAPYTSHLPDTKMNSITSKGPVLSDEEREDFEIDPKWSNLIHYETERSESSLRLQSNVKGGKAIVSANENAVGYFRTNQAAGILEEQIIIFPTTTTLVETYKAKQLDFVGNDMISLFAPLYSEDKVQHQESMRYTLLAAGLRNPKNIVVVEDRDFALWSRDVLNQLNMQGDGRRRIVFSDELKPHDNTHSPTTAHFEELDSLIQTGGLYNAIPIRRLRRVVLPAIAPVSINGKERLCRVGDYYAHPERGVWLNLPGDLANPFVNAKSTIVVAADPLESIQVAVNSNLNEDQAVIGAIHPKQMLGGHLARAAGLVLADTLHRYQVETAIVVGDTDYRNALSKHLKHMGLRVAGLEDVIQATQPQEIRQIQ